MAKWSCSSCSGVTVTYAVVDASCGPSSHITHVPWAAHAGSVQSALSDHSDQRLASAATASRHDPPARRVPRSSGDWAGSASRMASPQSKGIEALSPVEWNVPDALWVRLTPTTVPARESNATAGYATRQENALVCWRSHVSGPCSVWSVYGGSSRFLCPV